MLEHSIHNRIAKKLSPERERRLIWNTNTPDESTTDTARELPDVFRDDDNTEWRLDRTTKSYKNQLGQVLAGDELNAAFNIQEGEEMVWSEDSNTFVVQNDTRTDVENVLNAEDGEDPAEENDEPETNEDSTTDESPETDDQVLEGPKTRIDGIRNTLNNIKGKLDGAYEQFEKLDKAAESELDGESYKNWRKNKTLIAVWLQDIEGIDSILELLHKWQDKKVPPEEFLEEMNKLGNSYLEEGEDNRFSGISPLIAEAQIAWDGENESTTIENIHRVNEAIRLWDMLDEVDGMADFLQDGQSMVSDVVTEIGPMVSKTHDQDMGFRLKFYSALEVWAGIKEVAKGYKDAWEERQKLRSYEIAAKIGSFAKHLPFGDRVDQVMNSNLDRQSDEIKNRELSNIQSGTPGFQDTFGIGGLLEANMRIGDGNRIRAVLEYGAGRGWLYDIGEQEGVIFGHNIRKMVPQHWNQAQIDAYYLDLRQKNTSGKNKEVSEAKERGMLIDDTGLHIAEMEKELDRMNLWGAVGIVQAALARGLTGHVSPWLATRFMRVIRDNPDIRPFITRAVLDDIGGAAMYETYFTLGNVKAGRRDYEKWLKSDNIEDLSTAGDLGSVIMHFETQLFEVDESLRDNPKKLDALVAQALTGKNLAYKGTVLSLYDGHKSTSAYRAGAVGYEPEKPFSNDLDYYNGISEHSLLSYAAITRILNHSNGNLSDSSRAEAFLTKFLVLDTEMRKDINAADNPQEKLRRYTAWKNFQSDTSQKLTRFYDVQLRDARNEKLAGSKTATKDFLGNNQPLYKDGQPLIATMVEHGLISGKPFETAADDDASKRGPYKKGSEFGVQVVTQRLNEIKVKPTTIEDEAALEAAYQRQLAAST